MRFKVRTWSALFVSALAVVLVGGQLPATAAGLAQSVIASPAPFAKTPNIVDGTDASGTGYRVLDMAYVDLGTQGSRIVVVGSFAQVQDVAANGGTVYNRANIFSFDPSNGKVDPAFAPVVTGSIDAVAAGPSGSGTVYIGGGFSQVNGFAMRNVAQLNVGDGSRVLTWTSQTFNGLVNDVALSGGRLYVGGVFTAVNGVAHGGLASLSATTGSLDPYMSLDTAGHHNWPSGTASAPVGVSQIDISPDGSQMVAIGNFKTMEGLARDQVAKILLPSGNPLTDRATVDSNWATSGYTPACAKNAFDSYIRGVRWSPDGSYFVIVATGAYFANTLCDSAARFNLSDTGTDVQPAWADLTGGDTLWNVEITGSAVYVGGHQRWLNNPMTADSAAAGAVPRPGLAALDPDSGIPLTWNPGRNPRGIGAQALLATPTALYVGSDTDYIGNFSYKHNKLAAFPLAGGTTPPSRDTGALPANVYLAGNGSSNAVNSRFYDGTTAAPDASAPAGNVQWSLARGAFMAGNVLYYGYPDSPGTASSYELARQTFDGTTYGAVKAPPARGNQLAPNSNTDPHPILDFPYKDPYWDGVKTGSTKIVNKQKVPITYDGVFPSFYGTELSTVTGMFYWNGRLYYAKTGSSNLMYRLFSVDSGIVGQTAYTVPNTGFTIPGATGFSNAGGMFLSGGFLYIVNRNTGDLRKIAFSNTGVPTGTATTVSGPSTSDKKDWRAQALYIGPGGPATNQPPTASFTATCSGLTCNFDASASSDPNNDPLTYAWDFGDTNTGTGKTTSHTYSAAGTDVVTLTVNDGQGGSNSTQVTVHPSNPSPTAVDIRGASGTSSAKVVPSLTVPLPAGVQPGDGLVLVVSTYSVATGAAPGFVQPSGGLVANGTAMTTQVLERVADGSEGSSLTVTFSASAKATAQLVVYSGTPAGGPVRAVATKGSEASTVTHVTPTSTAAVAGDWVLSVWSDKSANARTWTAPSGVVVRDEQDGGSTGGEVSTLVADSGAGVSGGTVGGLTATTSATSTKATEMTIVIAGS